MFYRNFSVVPTGNIGSSDKAGSGRKGLGQPADIRPLREGQRWRCHNGASSRRENCGSQRCREDFSNDETVSEA